MSIEPNPASAPDNAEEGVRTRRIYYISGFDPRGAAFYYRLYREEAAKQSVHLDARIEASPRSRHTPWRSNWTLNAEWSGQAVSTEYNVLGWDDIVRRHWEPNLLRLLARSLSGYVDYAACGAMNQVRQTFRGPLFSALYPLLYLFLLVFSTVLVVRGVAYALNLAVSSTVLAWGTAAIGGAALFWGGIRLAHKLGIFWLLRTYLFVHAWGTAQIEALETRIDAFVAQIVRQQAEAPVDEVLIVGHSVGTMVAASVAARLCENLPGAQRQNVTLVTLGHCVPLLSLHPGAVRFRHDLQILAQADDMRWLDMAARADALCFSQANPLTISGITGLKADRPTAQVVRPFQMFDQKTYARMKRNKLRLHFQYLMASDRPNQYDYFRMTAGPNRIQAY